jgi:hypothetical protein
MLSPVKFLNLYTELREAILLIEGFSALDAVVLLMKLQGYSGYY